MFFAPKDVYEPCGMFTTTHFIALAICITLVALAVRLSRNFGKKRLRLLTKILAVALSVLEACKIIFNFTYGYTEPDSWLPFAFCSLFIYSLYLSGFGRGKLRLMGESYISCAGFVAGLAFLLVPSTSLTLYPIFHFLCFYSLLFHSLMLYLGITYVRNQVFIPSMKMFPYYAVFTTVCCMTAVTINSVLNCNMMFLGEPYHLPAVAMNILEPICRNAHPVYTLIIYSIYLFVPFFVTLETYRGLLKFAFRKSVVMPDDLSVGEKDAEEAMSFDK